MMRTTVTLEDSLLGRLREMAARKGRSISETLNEILSDALRRSHRKAAAFRLQWKVVKGKRPPAIDPADRDRLYDFLDEHR